VISRHHFILSGPTGIGKSSLGLRLAEHFGLEVMSIDSMAVYKGMDIGTAKPDAQERARIKHHLIDVVDPWENFNAQCFVEHAERTYDNLGGKVLGVGGTPFYIKALKDGLAEVDELPGLESFLSGWNEQDLRRALRRLDSKRELEINPRDRFRLVRALTLIMSSGKKATELKPKGRPGQKVTVVALSGDRKKMHGLLEQRIEMMFKRGLFEEVRSLLEGPELSRTAAAAVGYKELFQFFRGEISLEQAKYKILVGTRRLYKHQMTWLKKMDVHWVENDPKDSEGVWAKVSGLAKAHYEAL
jgi:tRNA dimethylallyltransferase